MSDVFMTGLGSIPIEPYTEVVCLLLDMQKARTEPHHQVTYHDDVAYPMGLPIFGKMGEKGGMMNLEVNPHMEDMLKSRKWYIRESYDYKEYEWSSMRNFMRQLRTNRLYYKVDYIYPQAITRMEPLEYVLVHRELYDKLLQHISKRRHWNETKNTRTLVAAKVREVLSFMESARATFEDNKQRLSQMTKEDDGYFELLRKVLDAESLTFYKLYSGERHAASGTDYFAELYLKNKDKSLITAITDYLLWEMVMSRTQMGYLCTPCNCDNLVDYPMQSIIHRFALSLVKRPADEDENPHRADIYIRPFKPMEV